MTSPIRILHLEDDAIDAELITMHLDSQGFSYKLVRVNSQAEFTAALEQGGFDLILSDNSGPRFRGKDALAMASEKLPHAAFLFVTGTVHGDADQAALKSGSDGLVLKHKLSDLVPAIQRALQAKNK
jgi:sigma-B regulation protein RsbU (phosphoserine phosphatase)